MLSFLEQSQHFGSVLLFIVLSRFLNDLQIYLILREERSGKAVSCESDVISEHHTWPMSAIVSPAKAPPRSTSTTATER